MKHHIVTQKDKHLSTRPFIVQEYANVYWLDFTFVSNHHTIAVVELFKTYFDHSNRKASLRSRVSYSTTLRHKIFLFISVLTVCKT